MNLRTALLLALIPGAALARTKAAHVQTDADPYLWLEDIDGAKPMDWVKTQNAATVKALASSPDFAATQQQILEVLDSDEKIPFVARGGDYLYNFWQDKQHPHGLWRRTTLDEYRKHDPKWEVLIDVDALGAAEKVTWVWHGAQSLKPERKRWLISLSRGGADADEVREFDIDSKAFVKDGFHSPEAKQSVAWNDRDSVFVATDFGPGSMTKSSYPRIVKLWKRGTPLSSATLVYEGKPDDVSVSAWRDQTPGYPREFVQRAIDFYRQEMFLRGKDGKLTLIDVPKDANIDVERDWMLVQLRSAWKVGEKNWPAGALLATRFDDFMAGKRELLPLFTPTPTTSLASWSWTKHHLILNTLSDVTSQVEVLTPAPEVWKRAPMAGLPPLSMVSADGADKDRSDEYFLTVTSFLTPTTFARGVLGEGAPEVLKRSPVFFDGSKDEVHQFFATSKDGTRVPYFVIAPKDLARDGKRPTLLYGYGGFEVSLQPSYSGGVGRAWLERGGVYVIANIRGGGEYGPRWHEAALRENRLRAYEDFAAVAEDLVAKKITSPAHLGIMGGSNGGLLMGNMLTLYPQLFGAVVCQVPLLDMKRYTHLSAGASWIAEYGDPDKPEEWAFIKTFSPYQNVKRGAKYPPILFTTSTRDDRVGPVHARKMAAKMLGFGDDVLFYENIEGGHGAAADNKERAFMQALGYRFLWEHVK